MSKKNYQSKSREELIVELQKLEKENIKLITLCHKNDVNIKKLLGEVEKEMAIRQKAEESIRESQELLTNIINSATEGFMLWDEDLNLLEINTVSLKAFPTGTKRNDLIGENIVNIIPDIKESGRLEVYKKVLATGQPIVIDKHIPHQKFGNIILYSCGLKIFS